MSRDVPLVFPHAAELVEGESRMEPCEIWSRKPVKRSDSSKFSVLPLCVRKG